MYVSSLGRTISTIVLLLLAATARADHHVVAYVPNWIDTAAFAPTIPYDKLTHINVAFENPNDAGELAFNPKNQALIDAARAKGVKVLISIGGGAVSGNKRQRERYFDLLTDAKRPAFVAGLVDYVVKHEFDGLDVDLEGPAINEDYGDFIADLDAALRPKGKLLTCALSKGYGGPNVPDAALGRFDFINIMAYDGAGPWNPDRPGPHSSFDFAKDSVAYWLGRGVPKERLVLGVPFYGHGFGDSFRNHGYGYDEILKKYPGSENADQAGSTIWFNGIPTMKAKTQYVVDEGLGGMMIWSLDNDVRDERSLLNAIDEVIKAAPKTAEP